MTVPDRSVLDVLTVPGGAQITLRREGYQVAIETLTGGSNGAFEGLLRMLRSGEACGRFVCHRLGDVPEASGERPIEVDQTNRSVVVGERAVVKVYPTISPGAQPALDLPAHLAAVGFVAMPTPYGAITWQGDDGTTVLVATAAAFLPGARDGWEWYLELLLGWLSGDTAEADAFEPAGAVGALAGSLHAALATASSVLTAPVTFVDRDEVHGWKIRAEVALDEALALTGGEEGRRLRAREGRIRAAFDLFDEVGTTPAMRIHGDLHVGQILRWDGGDAVTDLDGNPLAPPELRVARDTPTRDLAALVRSVDHVGRIAHRRRAGERDDIERWVERSRSSLVEGYLRGLDRGGHTSLFEPRLLFPLEVSQLCHEYAYAARFLPTWLPIPDLALQAVFP